MCSCSSLASRKTFIDFLSITSPVGVTLTLRVSVDAVPSVLNKHKLNVMFDFYSSKVYLLNLCNILWKSGMLDVIEIYEYLLVPLPKDTVTKWRRARQVKSLVSMFSSVKAEALTLGFLPVKENPHCHPVSNRIQCISL